MSFVRRVLFFFVIFFGLRVQAGVQRYDHEATRQLLHRQIENPIDKNLVVVGEPNPAAAKFLNFFKDRILPRLNSIEHDVVQAKSLILLMDSGSAVNAEESNKWKAEYNTINDRLNELSVDRQWTEDLKTWAKLAEGLTGELADQARRVAKRRDLEQFPEVMKPKMDEADRIFTDYQDLLRTVPANRDLGNFREAMANIKIAFLKKEITFDEAHRRVGVLYATCGYAFVGYQAASQFGEQLTKMAKLRTELAKSKGFPTWSAYILAVNAEGYAPEYQSVEKQRQFLKDYVARLRPLKKKYDQMRLRALEIPEGTHLTQQDRGLLQAPGLQMLQPYFPKETLTGIWEKTLLESGFSHDTLLQILVDDEFRDGKNRTGAYNMTVRFPDSTDMAIDASTLNFVKRGYDPATSYLGFTYILQSYPGGGLENLRTAFHEGGHATERMLKDKHLDLDEAYGTVEVPSLTMEYYLDDADFIFKNATPVNGEKPSLDEIRTYLRNSAQTDVLRDLTVASQGIFDIDLWDYDYTQEGAMSFLDRVKALEREYDQNVDAWPDIETATIPMFYHNVATSHFVSGNVRYIGYTFATIAASMMADYVSRELERETGRRSWDMQPALAEIFGTRIYKELWKKPFPQNVESITGRRFDPETIVKKYADALSGDACEDALTR